MKLSQREKQLLWCLINIGVLLLGVKWAFPKINDYHQMALEKLQTNENYALEASILLEKEKELPERLKQYKRELTEEASYYFSKLDSEYMEAWIMGISKRYPVNIGSLNIEAVRLLGEDQVMEVLPISMTLEGEEQTLIQFLDALVHDNRHVVIESVQLDGTSAQVRIALYRLEKESDPLESTPFNVPPGKGFLMKPEEEQVVVPDIETEIEPETDPIPEQNSSDLSALEMFFNQLMRPQENGNTSSQIGADGESEANEGAAQQEETQNKPEIEGDKDEDAAQAAPEESQAETTPTSNS